MKKNAMILLAFLAAVAGCARSESPVTYQEAEDPVPMTGRSAVLWQEIGGLN